jgi:hypothetical protein
MTTVKTEVQKYTSTVHCISWLYLYMNASIVHVLWNFYINPRILNHWAKLNMRHHDSNAHKQEINIICAVIESY